MSSAASLAAGESSSAADSGDRSGDDQVLIVGAGLAGLYATRALARRGVRVRVLEARDRVGGRTLSHRLPGGDVIELGAQWLGPGQDRLIALVAELGLPTLAQPIRAKSAGPGRSRLDLWRRYSVAASWACSIYSGRYGASMPWPKGPARTSQRSPRRCPVGQHDRRVVEAGQRPHRRCACPVRHRRRRHLRCRACRAIAAVLPCTTSTPATES